MKIRCVTFDEFGRINICHQLADGSLHRQTIEPDATIAVDPSETDINAMDKPLATVLGEYAGIISAVRNPSASQRWNTEKARIRQVSKRDL